MLGGTPLPQRFLSPLSPALNIIDAPATRSETGGCLTGELGFDGRVRVPARTMREGDSEASNDQELWVRLTCYDRRLIPLSIVRRKRRGQGQSGVYVLGVALHAKGDGVEHRLEHASRGRSESGEAGGGGDTEAFARRVGGRVWHWSGRKRLMRRLLLYIYWERIVPLV